MSWDKRHGKREERGYHHGNLREALVRAALDFIAAKGIAGFTMADAARAAGVSPAAPYRHFRDREELLAEVARQGFERFEAALAQAWNGGKPDRRAAFERLGRAYLDFARNDYATYAVMFEAGVSAALNPQLHIAAERALAVLRTACEALVEALPPGKRPPAMMMALHIWSFSHGIASLFGRSDAGRRLLPMPAEQLLEAGILVYLQGLGIIPPAK